MTVEGHLLPSPSGIPEWEFFPGILKAWFVKKFYAKF